MSTTDSEEPDQLSQAVILDPQRLQFVPEALECCRIRVSPWAARPELVKFDHPWRHSVLVLIATFIPNPRYEKTSWLTFLMLDPHKGRWVEHFNFLAHENVATLVNVSEINDGLFCSASELCCRYLIRLPITGPTVGLIVNVQVFSNEGGTERVIPTVGAFDEFSVSGKCGNFGVHGAIG
jgi:hypothetical protein